MSEIRIFFCLCHLTQFPDIMLTVKLYCIHINRTSKCLAAFFNAACCYQYQSSAVSLQHVPVSDSLNRRQLASFSEGPCPFSTAPRRNPVTNRFLKNTGFCRALVAEQCDMRFWEIDKKTKILYIIECRGPLLFLQSYIFNTSWKNV